MQGQRVWSPQVHLPDSAHVWFLRQQLHSTRPQHALGRREPLLQHEVQGPREGVRSLLHQSWRPSLLLHFLLEIAVVTVCASARRPAKSPSAEATRVAPPSFIALPREISPVSRPLARSSKAAPSDNEGRTRPPSLFVNNEFLLPFPAP